MEQDTREVVIGGRTISLALAPVWEAGVGGALFPGAVFLAEHIAERDFSGCEVLELGAGVGGLPGIVAAQRGASTTVFTDFEDVLPWLEPNIKANVGDALCELAQLDWRDLDNASATAIVDHHFHLILVA